MARAAPGTRPLTVFAAGSLRAPLGEVAALFGQATNVGFELVFGASGLLRERIGREEPVDVFASANMAHPESLVREQWSPAVPFVRNRLCALVRPDLRMDSENMLDVLLDPRVRVGTSTPRADPSGDYAREVFRRAEAMRPGSYALLVAKALQLTGGPGSPRPPANRNLYAMLVCEGAADVFLTYSTNAELAIAEVPALRSVPLPEALAVAAVYGVAARHAAPDAARAFVAFLRQVQGQRVFSRYGFAPP